jgi:hypothetical protein
MPRWRKVNLGKPSGEALFSIPDIGGPDEFAAGLALIVAAFVFALVLIPLLLFGIELIIVGLLVAAGVLGRSLLGRPWIVEATCAGQVEHPLAWKVVGWRRSRRLVGQVAAQLSSGLEPAPAEHAELIGGAAM